MTLDEAIAYYSTEVGYGVALDRVHRHVDMHREIVDSDAVEQMAVELLALYSDDPVNMVYTAFSCGVAIGMQMEKGEFQQTSTPKKLDVEKIRQRLGLDKIKEGSD